MEKILKWNTGEGNLSIYYEGNKDGPITLISDINEGVDRSQYINISTIKSPIITITRKVTQTGRRVILKSKDNTPITLSQNKHFNVLKDKVVTTLSYTTGGLNYILNHIKNTLGIIPNNPSLPTKNSKYKTTQVNTILKQYSLYTSIEVPSGEATLVLDGYQLEYLLDKALEYSSRYTQKLHHKGDIVEYQGKYYEAIRDTNDPPLMQFNGKEYKAFSDTNGIYLYGVSPDWSLIF